MLDQNRAINTKCTSYNNNYDNPAFTNTTFTTRTQELAKSEPIEMGQHQHVAPAPELLRNSSTSTGTQNQ